MTCAAETSKRPWRCLQISSRSRIPERRGGLRSGFHLLELKRQSRRVPERSRSRWCGPCRFAGATQSLRALDQPGHPAHPGSHKQHDYPAALEIDTG